MLRCLSLQVGPDKKGNEFKSFVAGADISEMVISQHHRQEHSESRLQSHSSSS